MIWAEYRVRPYPLTLLERSGSSKKGGWPNLSEEVECLLQRHVVGSPKWCFQSDKLRCLGELNGGGRNQRQRINAESSRP